MIKRSFKFRAEDDKAALNGYAFKFSEVADYLGQLERFSPDMELELNTKGTFLLRDHSPEKVMGRVGANMEVEKDNEGLRFSAKPLNTELWRDSLELIKKGVFKRVVLWVFPVQKKGWKMIL